MHEGEVEGLFLEILDDFYPDPEQIRHFALKCDFEPPFTGTWPGLQSLQRHPQTREVFESLTGRLPVTGVSSWEHVESSYRFWGRPSAGMFAVLLKDQADSVHFHRRSGAWAGVCYLSEEKACRSRQGVRFYRHKRTGITTTNGATRQQIEDLRSDAGLASAWEEIASVPMAQNRLVLFDGRFLHAASPGFGRGVSNGRLTQLFNIDILT